MCGPINDEIDVEQTIDERASKIKAIREVKPAFAPAVSQHTEPARSRAARQPAPAEMYA